MKDRKYVMNDVGLVFDNMIEIYDPTGTTENEVGEEVLGLVLLDTIYAKVEVLRGREYLEAQKLRPELQYRVTIRFRDDLHPAMIVKTRDNNELEIISILPVRGRKTYLDLMCVEKVKT